MCRRIPRAGRDLARLIRDLPLWLATLCAAEAGQDVVEYGLISATIALVVLIGTLAFGNQIKPWFESLAGMITTTGT